jgi:phosphate/sulfate permease
MKKALRKKFVLFFIVGLVGLSCSAGRKVGTSQVFSRDTATVQKTDRVKAPSNLTIPIGETLDFPELKISITRINDFEAVITQKSEVITQKETFTQFVATKTKVTDKAKDKSIRDSNVGSKIKDKSETDSNNKSKKSDNEKTKDNHKQVKRGFPWFVLLVAVVVSFAMWLLYKKMFK